MTSSVASCAAEPAAWVIPFPTLRPRSAPEFDPRETITLRAWYERCLLPEIAHEQSPRSLDSDRCALSAWERCTANPDVRSVAIDDLVAFRDRLLAAGCSPSTVNCYWRELKAIFAAAADAGLVQRVPSLGRRRQARLVKEPPKQQRETLSEAEVTELYRNCRLATYPHGGQFPAPLLWRVAIVLFWHYGARTLDMLRHLRWTSVRFGDRLLRFEAHKTSKLQGVPLTDCVIAHLRSIRGHSERVFPGFDTAGCLLRRGLLRRGKRPEEPQWKRGYYATWRHEIGAERMSPPVLLKHFRESMVTRYNAIQPDLGAWVAAHYMPGVTARHYDLPTERIRQAIESAPVPACFQEIG